jgi:hypothetical protein
LYKSWNKSNRYAGGEKFIGLGRLIIGIRLERGQELALAEAVPRRDRDDGDVLGLGEIGRERRSSTLPCWCCPRRI